jgi:hypothetical protein
MEGIQQMLKLGIHGKESQLPVLNQELVQIKAKYIEMEAADQPKAPARVHLRHAGSAAARAAEARANPKSKWSSYFKKGKR